MHYLVACMAQVISGSTMALRDHRKAYPHSTCKQDLLLRVYTQDRKGKYYNATDLGVDLVKMEASVPADTYPIYFSYWYRIAETNTWYFIRMDYRKHWRRGFSNRTLRIFVGVTGRFSVSSGARLHECRRDFSFMAFCSGLRHGQGLSESYRASFKFHL